eukprot:403351677
MKPILKQSLTNIYPDDKPPLNGIGSPQTNGNNKTQGQQLQQNQNPLFAIISHKKKAATSKLKPGKSSVLAKDRGKSLMQDPCLSFGCQCTVCKSHLTKMRQGGDINAIKAFQDEVNFRNFAAHQQLNSVDSQNNLAAVKKNSGNPREEYGINNNSSSKNSKQKTDFISTLQAQQLQHLRSSSLYATGNNQGSQQNLNYNQVHSRNVSNGSSTNNPYSSSTNQAGVILDKQIYQVTQQAQNTLGYKGGDFFSNAQENTLETSDGRIKFEKQSFQWLIEHLLAPNEKICGCELWMPDTAIFDQGKSKLIVKSDKDGFLVRSKPIANLQDLRRTFSIIVRERKKELDPFTDPNNLINSIGNQNLATNASNEENNVASPSSKMQYKDAIIIRFKSESKDDSNQEYVRVLSDTEFLNEFKRRANDGFWNTIDMIQTTIKSKIGLGKPFNFTFNSPCYKKDPVTGNIVQSYDGDIDFDFKQFNGSGSASSNPQSDHSLMTNSPTAYCLKVCHKIGFYLLKIHDLQLLRMKIEFYQDEYGRIWLFNANEIWIRTIRKDSLLMQAAAKNGINILNTKDDEIGASIQNDQATKSKKQSNSALQNQVSQLTPQKQSNSNKKSKVSQKEERDVDRAVDKELADLMFLHKNQRGTQQYQNEHDSLKPTLGQSQTTINGQQSHNHHALTSLAKQQSSMLALEAQKNPKLHREYQVRKKVGDVMVNYYNNMKRDEANGQGLFSYGEKLQQSSRITSNSRIINGDQILNAGNDVDSTLTDISTQNALAELRPKCPLRIQELIQREVKDNKNGYDIQGRPLPYQTFGEARTSMSRAKNEQSGKKHMTLAKKNILNLQQMGLFSGNHDFNSSAGNRSKSGMGVMDNKGFYHSQHVNVRNIMQSKLLEKGSLEMPFGMEQSQMSGNTANNQRFFSHRSISGMPNQPIQNNEFMSPQKLPLSQIVNTQSNYASSTPSIRGNANIASTKAMTSSKLINKMNSVSGSNGGGGSYCPPIRHFDMPSNNPFYNGTMLTEGHIFDNDDIPVNSTGVILKRNLDFSMMTKKQQTKIKTLLQARANYLNQAAIKIQQDTADDKNTHRLYDEDGNMLDLSYDELIRRREKQKELKQITKERKDHFFKNQHVFD